MILFVAAGKQNEDDSSYEIDSNPKDYSSEEELDNLPDVPDNKGGNGEGQPTDVDVYDEYVIKMLDHIIKKMNQKEVVPSHYNNYPKNYRKNEILTATKQHLVDYAMVYRIYASITIQETSTNCNFIVAELEVDDILDVIVNCDNDEYIELTTNKITK